MTFSPNTRVQVVEGYDVMSELHISFYGGDPTEHEPKVDNELGTVQGLGGGFYMVDLDNVPPAGMFGWLFTEEELRAVSPEELTIRQEAGQL